jgi:hypothetical protein
LSKLNRVLGLAILFFDWFYADMAFAEAFQNINVISTSNPGVIAQSGDVRSSRCLIDQREWIIIIGVDD